MLSAAIFCVRRFGKYSRLCRMWIEANGHRHVMRSALLVCVILVCGMPEPAWTAIQSTAPDDSALTVCFAGDLLLDRGVRTSIERDGIRALFASIAPVLRDADFTVANLECPATTERRPLNKKYIFRAEPAWLDAVREAGVTHVSLANNHSNDQGREGVVATAAHAVARGLAVAGYGRTQRQARQPALLTKGGDTVAVFATVLVPLENWMYRAELPGASQASAAELADDIAVWKRDHPGTVAIAFLHWGWEYHTTPNEQQRADAAMLIRAGCDAVIGHHPHVVQTIEYIDGRPVFYSLGNFVFDNTRDVARNGLVIALSVSRGSIASARLIPIRIDRCAPVQVTRDGRTWFEKYLIPPSPDIAVEGARGDWFLHEKSSSSPTMDSTTR
jgi:poly-gamma-glutamate capsule biosynthesis protein CapA/YwtB (metallophosphatase superfamily)